MRRFAPLAILAFISFLAFGPVAPARAKVWAVATPARVVPGGVFQVKAGDTEDPNATATAVFRGTERPLEPLRGVLRALVAAPASMKPGTYPVMVSINGRRVRAKVTVVYKKFPSQDIHMQPGKTSLMDPGILAHERAILNAAFDTVTPQPLWTGGFLVPAPGRSTSAWGRRRTVNGRRWGQHQGADIAATTGTPVRATNAGRVLVARRLWMRGNTVIIDHGFGVFSAYNHLSRLDVRPGEDVARGEIIGAVGATGFVTGPHLHWELHIGRVSVNPGPVIAYGLPLG